MTSDLPLSEADIPEVSDTRFLVARQSQGNSEEEHYPCRQGVLAGPWVNAFWVLTDSRIQSKSNFRRSSGSGAWRSNVEFEQSLAMTLRASRPSDWPNEQYSDPISERPVYVAVTIAKSTIDAGNHSKSVLDAAEGVVYTNDAQVAASCAIAERGLKNPYLLVAFASLPPGSNVEAVSAAASALLREASAVLSNTKD